MKKITILLAVIMLLAAAWLGASWYTGQQIEAALDKKVADFNTAAQKIPQAVTQGMAIKPLGYERGLFSSHARYGMAWGNGPMIEFDVALAHGPLPLPALAQGDFLPRLVAAHIEMQIADSEIKAAVDKFTGGKPPLVFDLSCDYGSKKCDGAGSMPSFSGDISPTAKLNFAGAQMRFAQDAPSPSEHKANLTVEILPVLINDQSFGRGQITASSDALSVTEVVSWQTDQGQSRITYAFAFNHPLAQLTANGAAPTPEDFLKAIKTASIKVELSKPMLIDMMARATIMDKATKDPAVLPAMRKILGENFDAAVMNGPLARLAQVDDKGTWISDWQYAGDKPDVVMINGKEMPVMDAFALMGQTPEVEEDGE
ncbi:MAG: YdgA family protein [Azonexus sp.]|jgi:hypothetical protein|nr:YdgA family protein [Azonexus sp.]